MRCQFQSNPFSDFLYAQPAGSSKDFERNMASKVCGSSTTAASGPCLSGSSRLSFWCDYTDVYPSRSEDVVGDENERTNAMCPLQCARARTTTCTDRPSPHHLNTSARPAPSRWHRTTFCTPSLRLNGELFPCSWARAFPIIGYSCCILFEKPLGKCRFWKAADISESDKFKRTHWKLCLILIPINLETIWVKSISTKT